MKTATTRGTTLISIYGVLFLIMIGYAWMQSWEFDMKVPIIVMTVGVSTTLLPVFASRGRFAKELERRKKDKSDEAT